MDEKSNSLVQICCRYKIRKALQPVQRRWWPNLHKNEQIRPLPHLHWVQSFVKFIFATYLHKANFVSLPYKGCFLVVLNELNVVEIPSKQLCSCRIIVQCTIINSIFHFLKLRMPFLVIRVDEIYSLIARLKSRYTDNVGMLLPVACASQGFGTPRGVKAKSLPGMA